MSAYFLLIVIWTGDHHIVKDLGFQTMESCIQTRDWVNARSAEKFGGSARKPQAECFKR